ncbi:hypothetical protein F5B22DRAFT_612566 [Xylaria bambusicola]|uniref:uncharacterized protein n=1 Tax=Xylaria bambusicola TaxID=326684 RepID=UPI00200778B4|nr:uncharacterized protein F5B22DRAFT_612566 [Xylaria bambusicola]KAI0513178.1 hypothetical protein F5B22DRAFT_612566 [Xylaria bambusicola]
MGMGRDDGNGNGNGNKRYHHPNAQRYRHSKQSTCFRAAWFTPLSSACCRRLLFLLHARGDDCRSVPTETPGLTRPSSDPGAEILPPAVACYQRQRRSDIFIGCRRLYRRYESPIWLLHDSFFAASRPSFTILNPQLSSRVAHRPWLTLHVRCGLVWSWTWTWTWRGRRGGTRRPPDTDTPHLLLPTHPASLPDNTPFPSTTPHHYTSLLPGHNLIMFALD